MAANTEIAGNSKAYGVTQDRVKAVRCVEQLNYWSYHMNAARLSFGSTFVYWEFHRIFAYVSSWCLIWCVDRASLRKCGEILELDCTGIVLVLDCRTRAVASYDSNLDWAWTWNTCMIAGESVGNQDHGIYRHPRLKSMLYVFLIGPLIWACWPDVEHFAWMTCLVDNAYTEAQG